MEPQDSYEQLKRRNRRRLVGALAAVLIAGGLLLTILNRQSTTPENNTDVAISGLNTASAPASEAAASMPAAAQAASEVEHDAVTVPETASAASVDNTGNTPAPARPAVKPAPRAPAAPTLKPAPKPVLVEPVHQPTTPAAAKPRQPAREKPISTAPTVTRPQAHPEKTQPAAVKTHKQAPEPATVKTKPHNQVIPETTPAVKNKVKPAETKPHSQTADTPVKPQTHAATKPHNQVAETTPTVKNKVKPAETKSRKTVQATAKPDAAPKKSAEHSNKLSPQDILNNKAAGAVRNHATTAGDNKKVFVQVGAYTDEQQARNIQQKLAAAGIHAHVIRSQTSKGTLYRVRTSTYANRQQAQQGLGKIQGTGLDGLVIGQ